MKYNEYVASVEKSLDKFLTNRKFNLKRNKNLIFKEYILQYMYKINNNEQDFTDNIKEEIANFYNTTISDVNNKLSSVKNFAVRKGYLGNTPRDNINKLTAIFIVDFLKECGVTSNENN